MSPPPKKKKKKKKLHTIQFYFYRTFKNQKGAPKCFTIIQRININQLTTVQIGH